MSYTNKPGTGVIFKNDKKKETQPDYKGTINVDGKDLDIALWVKEGKKGKFFSAAIKEKQVKEQGEEMPF